MPLINNRKTDYLFLFIWCFLWFAIDPILSSHRLLQLNVAIRLLLFSIIFIGLLNENKRPNLDIIGWFLLFGFLVDLLNGNLFPSIKWIFLFNNLGLLLILTIYIDSYDRLLTFVRIFLSYIFITVILIGIYQYSSGHSIYNFRIDTDLNSEFYLDAGRLTGLIYRTSNDAASFILIFFSFIFSLFLSSKYLRAVNFFLLIFTIFALFITYTRSAWLGFIISTSIFLLLGLKGKGRSRNNLRLLFSITIFFVLLLYIFYGSKILSSSMHSERINSMSNFFGRLYLYELVINNVWSAFWGNGLHSDPTNNFHKISQIYITTENQFLNWFLLIGLPGILFIMFRIFRQLYLLLLKLLKSKFYNKDYYVGLALLAGQISIIISEMATTNLYFLILLFYILIKVYISKGPILQIKPISE